MCGVRVEGTGSEPEARSRVALSKQRHARPGHCSAWRSTGRGTYFFSSLEELRGGGGSQLSLLRARATLGYREKKNVRT